MSQPRVVEEFLRNRELLFGFILSLTRNHAMAEDVFQEVGVAILDEAAKGTQPRDFMSWAREIARIRAAAYFRKNSKFQSMADVIGQAFDENLMTASENSVRQDLLQECLKSLAPKSREVIDRRYGEDLSVKDIADRMDWTVPSVKVALARARKALSECVSAKWKREHGPESI
jgi:RNA polymerase sigma-70 factor (ECF subfamily)